MVICEHTVLYSVQYLDWFNLCKHFMVERYFKRGKMSGQGYIVRIDINHLL